MASANGHLEIVEKLVEAGAVILMCHHHACFAKIAGECNICLAKASTGPLKMAGMTLARPAKDALADELLHSSCRHCALFWQNTA